MVPVEHTRKLPGSARSACAAEFAMPRALVSPSSPVAAFAHPAFVTTPQMRPPVEESVSLQTRTGAAAKVFCVNTPAVSQGPAVVQQRAKSGRFLYLIPASTPAQPNPLGRAKSVSGSATFDVIRTC